MARDGLTFEEISPATELDERTLRGLLSGKTNAHARTLHKLAEGLGVEMHELILSPGRCSPHQLERATNTLVEEVIASRTDRFSNWSQSDFVERFSRFGTGGLLTPD